MSWREKTLIRILLLVARIIASGIPEFDRGLADELRHLANHVHVAAEGEK